MRNDNEAARDAGLPWWPAARDRTPAREPLDRDLIVSTAIRIADAEGLEALSMRRLGQELGAGATSLYRHVANKDELLDLAIDVVLGEVPDQDAPAAPWQDRVAALARAVRRTLLGHPGIAMLLGSRVTRGPNALSLADRLLGILRAAGLDGAQLGLAYQVVTNWSVGSAAVESHEAMGRGPDRQTRAQQEEIVTAMLAALPRDRYPNVGVAFDHASEMTSDAQFEYGLQALITGIAANLPSAPDA